MRDALKILYSKFYILYSRSGFTLLELIIFIAISTTGAIAFLAILVAVTRVQVRQTAASEVNQQSQFLLQTIQRYIETASLVDATTTDATSSALTLRMSASSTDKIVIYLASSSPTVGTVYIKQTDSRNELFPVDTIQPLTSDKVNVSNLSFIKHSNPPGHDSVSVIFVMQFATQNVQQRFAQALQTSVARVSAATFDSSILPSSGALDLGTSAGYKWNSVNQVIYFSGNNVGISGVGASFTPHAALHVQGGDIYVEPNGYGLILQRPNGLCSRISVTNANAITAATTTCPS